MYGSVADATATPVATSPAMLVQPPTPTWRPCAPAHMSACATGAMATGATAIAAVVNSVAASFFIEYFLFAIPARRYYRPRRCGPLGIHWSDPRAARLTTTTDGSRPIVLAATAPLSSTSDYVRERALKQVVASVAGRAGDRAADRGDRGRGAGRQCAGAVRRQPRRRHRRAPAGARHRHHTRRLAVDGDPDRIRKGTRDSATRHRGRPQEHRHRVHHDHGARPHAIHPHRPEPDRREIH